MFNSVVILFLLGIYCWFVWMLFLIDLIVVVATFGWFVLTNLCYLVWLCLLVNCFLCLMFGLLVWSVFGCGFVVVVMAACLLLVDVCIC